MPAMCHKTLIGVECYETCNDECKQIHTCDPDNCMLFCNFKKLVSGGEVPYIDLKGKKRKTHQCGKDECEMTCHFKGSFKRQCGRVDDHECDEGSCNTTCLLHHPIEDYGKCPGVVFCKILPPQNCLFPILRVTVTTKSGEEKLVAPLCRTCAMTIDPFDSEAPECCHTDEDKRALTGTFTLSEVAYALKEQKYQMKEIYQVFFTLATKYLSSTQ